MISNFLKMLFKQKGIELTTDDLQMLDEFENPTGAKADTANVSSDISHNLKVINELKQGFEKQLAEIKQERDAYKAEITELTKIIGEERTAREASLKAIQEKQEKEQAEKIENLIKNAVETKRIPAQNNEVIEKLKSVAKADFEAAKAIVDAINPILENTQTQQQQTAGIATKTDTIHKGIAGGADPKILAFVEQQFAALDKK